MTRKTSATLQTLAVSCRVDDRRQSFKAAIEVKITIFGLLLVLVFVALVVDFSVGIDARYCSFTN